MKPNILLAIGASTLCISEIVQAGTLTVPQEYSTIQSAINAAHNGDMILVGSGEYTELITITRDIQLIGAGPLVTILNAQIQGSAITVDAFDAASIRIEGFTIKNGAAYANPILETYGGAIRVFDSTVTVDNCWLIDSVAMAGGGLSVINSIVYLNNCIIENNTAGDGGLGGGIYSENSNINLYGCIVQNNSAYQGGGIYKYGDGIGFEAVENSSFISNIAFDAGGAIYAIGDLTVLDSVFDSNTSSDYGGALHLSDMPNSYDAEYYISGSTFVNNTKGAIAKNIGHLVVIESSFIANTNGPAIWQLGYTAEITNCVFMANSALLDQGGGIYNQGGNLTVNSGQFCDNYPSAILGCNLEIGSIGSCVDQCLADLNYDGVVNTTDLLLLFAAWGVCD